MKIELIEPSVEDITQKDLTLNGVYKQIERCARISYKSEDGVTETSAIDFVERLIKNGHLAPLEHGTVLLESKSLHDMRFVHDILDGNVKAAKYGAGGIRRRYIITNLRELYKNNLMERLKLITQGGTYNSIGYVIPWRYSFKMVLPISISREFCRHRVFSFMEQSTRYCNYSKDKFDNHVSFIKPYWYDDADEGAKTIFLDGLQSTNDVYISLIERGLKPQQAREALPLDTKTELIMTGWKEDWDDFFRLRLSPSAHPMARKIAGMIKEQMDEYEQ